MRALLRLCLLALVLAAGCGQKGPLTLRPVHSKTGVAAPAASSNSPAAVAPPETTAPADSPGQPAPGQPTAAPAGPRDGGDTTPPAPRA